MFGTKFSYKPFDFTKVVMLLLALAAVVPLSAQQPSKAIHADDAESAVLNELNTSFEKISERAGLAVVQIMVRSYVASDTYSAGGDVLTAQNSSGSGIILSPDGYILTNAHVVNGARTIRVRLNVRRQVNGAFAVDRSLIGSLPAKLIGIDPESDLAVVKIAKEQLPYLAFGDSDSLKQGQLVLALGNPLGLENSVSLGVVSAVSREAKPDDPIPYIQTDAPINPGNSGGPLIDTKGHVMGVNTFILSQSGGSEGVGFAIPSSVAHAVYTQLKESGHTHRSRLGIVGRTINSDMVEGLNLPAVSGVIVSDVEANGPAERAGLKAEDIVTGLNGRRIDTRYALEASVFQFKPGTSMVLTVQRGNQSLEVPVVAEERLSDQLDLMADGVDPIKNGVPQIGIVGINITNGILRLMPNLRRPAGVVVVARKNGAATPGVSLQIGDAIYAVNRTIVGDVAQLRGALDGLGSGQAAVLLIERGGKLIYIPFEID